MVANQQHQHGDEQTVGLLAAIIAVHFAGDEETVGENRLEAAAESAQASGHGVARFRQKALGKAQRAGGFQAYQ